MKTRTLFAAVGALLFVASVASAQPRPMPARDHHVLYGGSSTTSKAAVDTIDLMGPSGSGSLYLGDFESGWNGWTSADMTAPLPNHWQVSDYNQSVNGNLAAWCGVLDFDACVAPDTVGGYGNDWVDPLELRLTVADPLAAATVRITATLQYDTEPGEDYVYLMAAIEGSYWDTELQRWHYRGTASVDETFTYLPGELVAGAEVVVKFLVRSDGGWSDEDCNWATAGACQLDDVTVTVSQNGQADLVSFTDFQDGTFGDWNNPDAKGVGDFAQLWTGLEDNDPCASNYSTQVAFIDDGVVEPGTGGSECINWCYGPMGYIVSTDGGLMTATSRIWNTVFSPVMTWPVGGGDGVELSFDVYRHEDLDADAPGIFYIWSVRSADTDNSAGNGVQNIETEDFRSHNYALWGPGEYVRETHEVTDLMSAGRDQLQLQVGVYQLGWAYGWSGNDGYPAPYFDNIAVKVYPLDGPVMTAKAEDLAQDNFPETDTLDYDNPGTMHVRFDAARNISTATGLHNDPGDSLVVLVRAMRTGAVLIGPPQMHYAIDTNPMFDAFRTVPAVGAVVGVPAVGGDGSTPADLWAFDLPDTGALFPGDALHYYFRAGDTVSGDEKYVTLPADLTDFGVFGSTSVYDLQFMVHALPTIRDAGAGNYWTPPILVWDDSGDAKEARWLIESLTDLGFHYRGQSDKAVSTDNNFDFYRTAVADMGLGNGLGGRTSGTALVTYDDMIYRAGRNGVHTLSQGDYERDQGNDIGALLVWLAGGNKDMYLSGDGVISDLATNQGVLGATFLSSVVGVDVVTDDVRALINNQAFPVVRVIPGHQVFVGGDEWAVYGGCPRIRTFDGVRALNGTDKVAEFTDPNGIPGAYIYAAAAENTYNSTNRIVSMPYDVAQIVGGTPVIPFSKSTAVLGDVLVHFGYGKIGAAGETPAVPVFDMTSYPNPFNPATRLDYTIGAAGHLSLKIYNIRGQLVRTLIDRTVVTSGHVMWDGTNNAGAQVSSGVYFSEARLGDQVKVHKLALVK